MSDLPDLPAFTPGHHAEVLVRTEAVEAAAYAQGIADERERTARIVEATFDPDGPFQVVRRELAALIRDEPDQARAS